MALLHNENRLDYIIVIRIYTPNLYIRRVENYHSRLCLLYDVIGALYYMHYIDALCKIVYCI